MTEGCRPTAVDRPLVDWSQFAVEKSELPEPIIFLKQELVDSDDGYEIFRRLSHKVAGCRYDVPFGHKLIVAYLEKSDRSELPQVVGVISFWTAEISENKMKNQAQCGARDIMDDYFHKVSFLFVDKHHQRKGVGSLLLKQAIAAARESGIKRPIHVEAAKSAIKFFRKMDFTPIKKSRLTTGRGSYLFRQCLPMQLQI